MSLQQEKELLESLTQKLQKVSVHRQSNALEGKKIDEKIRIAFRNPPKRPKITLEKIEMDVESLELRRTTTSMSLNDEKTILREIQSLKEMTKQLEVCTAFQETIEALKRTRAERMKQHDVYTQERDQIELQLKRIALAQRLHVPSCEFVTIEVSVPEDKIGKSLSKKSLRIDEIQSKCHVLLEFHPTKPMISVWGTPGNAHLAMEHIEDVTLATTHTFGLHPDTIQLLLIQKCKNLHALEQTHGVRLHLNRVEGVLTLHASPARLQQVQKSIEELNQLTKEIFIPAEIVPQLIGKKGETINRLMEDTEALVLIDNVSNVVRLCGTHESVMRAHAFVTELIREKTKTERFFKANDANVFPTLKDEYEFAFFAAFLVSEKGKQLRMLRANASEVRVKVLKDEQRIQVNGTRAQIAEVETALRDRLRAFEAQHWTHKVTDPHHISLIVGKNGSMIKQIEESCQGMVRFDTHKQHICVFGDSRDMIERARSQIMDIIDRNQRSVYMTSFHIAVLLLGNKRLKLTELEKATDCRFSIQMPSDRESSAKHTLPIKVVLQGSSIAISAAKNALQSFENDHTAFYLPLDADEISTIVGKKGETISQIAKSTGARLHLNREAQAGAEVEIIGTEHQVASARRQIDAILQTHYQKVLHLDSLSIACLIGKEGERIKSLREEHPETTVTVSAKLGHVRVKAHAAEPLEACVNAIFIVLETIQTETVSIPDGSNRDFMSILQAHPSIPSALAELEARGGTSMKVSIMENGKIAKIRGPVRGITKLKDYLFMLSSKDAYFTERVKLPSDAFSSTLFATPEPTSMECVLNENGLRIVRQTACELRMKKTSNDRLEILIEGTQLHHVYVAKQSVENVLAFYYPKCFRILDKLSHDFLAQLYAKLPQLAIDDAVELTRIDPSSLRVFADTEENVQLAARTILSELENWESHNFKLTIPNWLVPILLGKNGDTIRALSKEIGARLELDTVSKKATDSNAGVVSRARDPILTITADDESCAKAAARRILDFQTSHETHTARIGVAKDMIGMLPLLRKKVKSCQIHTLEAPDQAKQVDLLLYSPDPASRHEALNIITSLAADFLATTIDLSASMHSTAVNGIIGALIGKNGSNIKVLQSEFPNVFVEVHREHHQISIKGARGDVLKVRTIVEDKVSELAQSRSNHSPAAFHPESSIENEKEAVVAPIEKDVTAHDPNAADSRTQPPALPIGGSLATSNKLDKNQRRRMRRRAENEMKTAATDL